MNNEMDSAILPLFLSIVLGAPGVRLAHPFARGNHVIRNEASDIVLDHYPVLTTFEMSL